MMKSNNPPMINVFYTLAGNDVDEKVKDN